MLAGDQPLDRFKAHALPRGVGSGIELAPADRPGAANYYAVVLGSAIRMGKVLPELQVFVEQHKNELDQRPIAYFVVCMTMKGDTPENRATASGYLGPLRGLVSPIDVGLFAGKMDYSTVSWGSGFLARVGGASSGDFRDFILIAAWAAALGSKLRQQGVSRVWEGRATLLRGSPR